MLHTRRPSISLDGTWEFVPDTERLHAPDRLPIGQPINVPGAWEAQLSDPYGIAHAWYRRRFIIPQQWRNGRLVLRFGSAMSHAEVWLDGAALGSHDLGYLSFEIDAGDAEPGSEHELVVSVANPFNVFADYPASSAETSQADGWAANRPDIARFPRGKQTWYTSTSGLLGSVSVELAPDPRFGALLVLPDLEGAQAIVRWRLEGRREMAPGAVDLTVTSPGGTIVSRARADARAGSMIIPVPRPESWDIGRPALYRLDANLSHRGGPRASGLDEVEDRASVQFGMRSISVRAGEVLLNGRPIYLLGALDQDFWPDGRSNPPSREALEQQVGRARHLGLNLLRCHIKLPDPAYFDVTDAAGMLAWCELPTWSRFDTTVAGMARRMLDGMVETYGNHPSIIAWTVINEGWGVDLFHEARDRRWLRGTTEWLKALDPTRLVVDNSACETSDGPGFHLRTDLVDFHVYRSTPDRLHEWRAAIEDLARRPAWLWSPHGDALCTGDEALILSEFGGWGLPKVSMTGSGDGSEPWWWATGEGFCRPAGIHERFERQGLGRIWADVDALAEATQWRQFEGLAQQIQEVRRHDSIKGYVITELSDAFWEANGLLDVAREPKAFHDRIAELNDEDALIVDLPRDDLWGGETLAAEVTLSSYSSPTEIAVGELAWQVHLADGQSVGGSAVGWQWPRFGARSIGHLEVAIPNVGEVTNGELVVNAICPGHEVARYRRPIVVVPGELRLTACPRRFAIIDALDLWSIGTRMRALGHHRVSEDEADLVVSAELDQRLVDAVGGGLKLLLLARSSDSVPANVGLSRPMVTRARRPPDSRPAPERPWQGDWVSVFAWALPGVVPGLASGGFLGARHREVFPDLVLDGLDVRAPADGVGVGLFAGWIHRPVALLAEFDEGAGRVTVTTLKLAPEDGPIATALLESLIQRSVSQ